MAHDENMEFFKIIFDQFKQYVHSQGFLGVVDLGSLDINGGPHQLLPKKVRYVGIDLNAGPNVDLACPIELVDLPSLSFGLAMSSEMLEHNPYYRESLYQMLRLTSPGALIIWTCAGIGRPEHGTTRSDGGSAAPFVVGMGREYYKNISAKDAATSFNHELWFEKYAYFENYYSRDTYFIGVKKGIVPTLQISLIETYEAVLKELSYKYVTKATLRSYLHSHSLYKLLELLFVMEKKVKYARYYLFLVLTFYKRTKFVLIKRKVLIFFGN